MFLQYIVTGLKKKNSILHVDVAVFPRGEEMGGLMVEEWGLAVGISCNPIWEGGDAPRKIVTGIKRETVAETGGNKEPASKHSERKREKC